MTIARTYECPGTATHPPHRFRYLHHPSVEADPLPRFCGICGCDGTPDEAVMMPHLARPIGNSVDGLVRAMEEGADHRANMAMEHLGMDAEGAAAMRQTNMRDNIHPGDTSEAPVVNDITRIMDAAPPGVFGFQSREAGLGYSQTGHGNAGAKAQRVVRNLHAQNSVGAGHAGPVVSNTPALETTQPGYRRRV